MSHHSAYRWVAVSSREGERMVCKPLLATPAQMSSAGRRKRCLGKILILLVRASPKCLPGVRVGSYLVLL
jgi:hypothetical protein